MPTSRGRYCPRCRSRISRRIRLCPVCGRLNLKPVDHLIVALVAGAILYAILRWA